MASRGIVRRRAASPGAAVLCAVLWVLGLPIAGDAAAAPGSVWYVAVNGSDDAAGTAASPFRTLSRALAGAKPGDTVHVRAGIYTERVVIKTSGAPDKPVILEGERGPRREWLTIIDGSAPLQVKWLPAPEVGKGVYKTPFPGFEPRMMLVEGKFIPRIWQDHMADGEGFKKLAYSPDEMEMTDYAKAPVKFWDTVGAMFGCKDGTVYLRFRNYDDPNTKDLRAAPAGGGVHIENQSHLVVRDLQVRGGENGVQISGAKAAHNTVENCRLVNASERVRISDKASRNVIRNNEMTIDFYADACKTGAWGTRLSGEAVPYELRLKQHFYRAYKLFFGPNGTSDNGVVIFRAGPGNEVCNNLIYRGGIGVEVYDASDVDVHDNTVYGFSSIGLICTLVNTVNIRFHDNLVYDCNINVRIHHVNEPRQKAPRSLYVYRNRLYEPPHVGEHIFFHYHEKNDVEDYLHPNVYIYQNSFAGGNGGLIPSGYAEKCGGLPNCLVVNNVISTDLATGASMTFIKQPKMWAAFDYNWIGGDFKTVNPGHDFTKAPWYGERNIFEKGGQVWDGAKMPDFRLPPGSAARNAGIDLSKPFELNGRTHPPLPGMEPAYFKGARPDLGAVQSE